MLKRCAGACHGAESLGDHEMRLRAALQHLEQAVWPFPGAVALKEERKQLRQFHVLRNWHYPGSATSLAAARKLRTAPGDFDRDCDRIYARAFKRICTTWCCCRQNTCQARALRQLQYVLSPCEASRDVPPACPVASPITVPLPTISKHTRESAIVQPLCRSQLRYSLGSRNSARQEPTRSACSRASPRYSP